MKKVIAILLSLVTLTSMSACNSKSGRSDNTSLYEQVQTTGSAIASEPTKLTNKMTENELQFTKKHGLTLLDELKKPSTDPNAEHTVSIEFCNVDPENWRASLEEKRDQLTDDEYNNALKQIQKAEETGSEYRAPNWIISNHISYLVGWA